MNTNIEYYWRCICQDKPSSRIELLLMTIKGFFLSTIEVFLLLIAIVFFQVWNGIDERLLPTFLQNFRPQTYMTNVNKRFDFKYLFSKSEFFVKNQAISK